MRSSGCVCPNGKLPVDRPTRAGLADSPSLLTEHINNNTVGLPLSPKHNYIIHHAFCAALTHIETWPAEPRWWRPSAGVITIDNV